MTLRDFVGDLIGQFIPKNGWNSTYKELDSANKFDEKIIKEIIIELCKRVEALENERPNPSIRK